MIRLVNVLEGKKIVHFLLMEDGRVLQGEVKIKGPMNARGAVTLH